MKRDKINVEIHEPIEIAKGVFKTVITHQKLEGELSFVHGENNREQTLSAIQNSIIDDIKDIIDQVNDLTKKTSK